MSDEDQLRRRLAAALTEEVCASKPTKSIGTRMLARLETIVEDMATGAVRNTIQTAKQNNRNAVKGRVWEAFSAIWLRACWPGASDVWLLRDVPADEAMACGIVTSRDVGIDIVVKANGRYVAVQAKYRGGRRKVPWKDLSTFESLCHRSGPWAARVVLTNGAGVLFPPSHPTAHPDGPKTTVVNSRRIASATYQTWLAVLNSPPVHVVAEAEPEITPEELRRRRLLRFEAV